MNKFEILRTINKELKYNSITEHLGFDVVLDLSKEDIEEEIKALVEKSLDFKVKSSKNNIKGSIAKYGIVDVSFEIESSIELHNQNGLQALRDNGWDKQEESEEYKDEGLEFLKDMIDEIREDKMYLKIYASVATNKDKWRKEKSYLFSQFLKEKTFNPKPKDRFQLFVIDDMCLTNYAGIWLWKHFYM